MRGTLLSLILLPIVVFSAQKTQVHHTGADVPFEPWLTGPLLAATAINLEVGHPAILMSFTFLNTYGDYDSSWKFKNEDDIWSISLLLDFEFAITERIGMEVFGTGTMRFEDGDSVAEFDDTFLLLAYQISNDIKDSWVPDCRFYIQAIFPSGVHDGLDARRRRALAISGQGAYFVGPGISCQKLFYLPHHFLMLHWGAAYNFPSKAKVRDFGVYGGGIGTKGKLRPGQFLNAFVSAEYALNQNWALAMDVFLLYQRETSRFKGRRGFAPDGEVAQVGLPSSTQISITPSIEYSKSPQLGWLIGAWLTIAGKNAGAFAGGFLQFAYVF